LMPAERPIDKRGKRPPQRQLAADRLRKLEHLQEFGRRAAAGAGTRVSAAPLAPAAAPARSQSFGHSSAWEPGKLSNTFPPQRFQLLTAALVQAEQAERERCEEFLRVLVRDDQRLAWARDVGSRECGKAAAGRGQTRGP